MPRRRSIPSPLGHDTYFLRSQQPLHMLMFLLPLIAVYELGMLFYAGSVTNRRLAARSWVQEFLDLFGAVGDYLPGLLVVAVLLAMHVAQRRKWRFRPWIYVAMFLESVALAVPLLVFSMVTGPRHAIVAQASSGGGEPTWQAWMILSIGAGIYEELVFRLFLIALVHFIAVDIFKLTYRNGALLAIFVSTGLFAISHFDSFEKMNIGALAFYCIAGFYFSLIFVLRGFGVVAATHAFYDVFVIALRFGLLPGR